MGARPGPAGGGWCWGVLLSGGGLTQRWPLPAEDAPFATLAQIGGDGANLPTVDQPIIRTIWVGARLAPVLGFSHGSDLRSSGGVLHTDRKFGLFSFSKYYRVSTNSLAYRKIQTICGVVMFLNVQFFLNETMTPYGATFLMITVEICPAASLSPAILMRSWAISNVNFTGSPHCSLPPGSTFALTRVQPPLNRPCG